MQKPLFIPGLSEQAKNYKNFMKYLNVFDIDWNNPRYYFGKQKVIIGFSMGAILACIHAFKGSVDTLVLCSMTPGAESLKGIKVKKVIFIAGAKEKWIIKYFKSHLSKTISKKIKKEIIIVPNEGHRIKGKYAKVLFEVLKKNKII